MSDDDNAESAPPASDLDAYGRTPEEAAADSARFKRELEQERRKYDDPLPLSAERRAHVDNGESLAETLARINKRVEEEGAAELDALVCRKHSDEDDGVDACVAAGAYKECRWKSAISVCPRARSIEFEERVHNHLYTPAETFRVPPRERDVILKSIRRTDRQKLWPLDSLQVVRSALTRKRVRVPLENGCEVRREPGHAVTRHKGEVFLVGDEVLVVLAGNQGRGKTIASCYAIAREGGLYTCAAQWTMRGKIDVDAAIDATVLVIDQFGREHWGESHWALSQLEHVLDRRSQSLSKWTFLLGNITVETFLERLKDTTIADRIIGGYGVFVELGGESVRATMRDKALRGQP